MLQRFLIIAFLAIAMGSYASDDQSEQKRREEACIKVKERYRTICQNNSFHFFNPAKSADCFGIYHMLETLCKPSREQLQAQLEKAQEHE